jgi:DNA-binding beta-propeller fold protein YncE
MIPPAAWGCPVTQLIRPVLALPLLVWSGVAHAAAPAPRADALPAGAVARLGSVRWRLLAEPHGIAVSPNGTLLAVTTRDGAVELLDARTGQRRLTFGARDFKSRYVRGVPVAFSRDGKRVAAAVLGDRWTPALSIRDRDGKHEERRIHSRN